MTPKIQISLEDVSEDHKNRYGKVGNLPQIQFGLDQNLIAVDIVAVSIEVCGNTASVDLAELESALQAIRAVARKPS